MTTLELYRKHKKGEIGRDRFLYEVRRDNNLPWITNITSYDDAVKILKNKGVIREAQFEPQNIPTDPLVDRVNPYALKREVDKLLSKETELTNDSYKQALNKAAKKLTTPEAVKKAMFANAETVEKADAKLQMQPVKKANHKDKANEMKKAKGQQAPKATAAPTGENKKTKKPKGVEIMKDKGVEGSEKVLREAALSELQSYLKKKLAENSTHYEFHEGMEVETAEGTCIVKEINGGTLTVETKDGKLMDVQMNHAKHFMQKKKEEGAIEHSPKVQEEASEMQDELEPGDRIKVTYGNKFYGMTGTIEDVKGGFVIVSIDDEDGEYSMHSSDVEKTGEEEDDDQFYGEDDLAEARDINDPALVAARAKQIPTKPETNLSLKNAAAIKKLQALKDKIEFKMENDPEVEPQGGPVADKYGEMLNKIDTQIAKLRKASMGISEDEIGEAQKFKASGETIFKSDTEAAGYEADLKKAGVKYTKTSAK